MQKISSELRVERYGSTDPFLGTGKWRELPQKRPRKHEEYHALFPTCVSSEGAVDFGSQLE
jgi:hypothetical protein